MSRNLDPEEMDPFNDVDISVPVLRLRHLPPSKLPRQERKYLTTQHRQEIADSLTDIEERSTRFNFTYTASRYERQWLLSSLGGFYEQHWIDDVLRVVKGGKEASVYLCAGGPAADTEYLAAKVYRPRVFRNLKNDAAYREGRNNLDEDGNVIIDHGMEHAIHKRTDYGLELAHISWIEHEYQALAVLNAAGADTPKPYTRGNNAILMEYIGEPVSPAPTLNTVEISLAEARRLFERVIKNIQVMLAHNRVHADLSAYNILYWEGDITIIDFPQVVNADGNREAFHYFERDITRICEYFSRQGIRSSPHKLAVDLWQANHRRVGVKIHPRDLDGNSDEDKAYWTKYGDSR